VVVVAIINGPDYFNYLTNWGNCLMAINFNILSACHFFLGHHSCRKHPSKWPVWSHYWKLATFIYEVTAVMILLITVSYWLVVFPCLLWGPEWFPPGQFASPISYTSPEY